MSCTRHTMPSPRATAMALEFRRSVLPSTSYGKETDSSTPVQPSHKMCTFHAVSHRKQHRFQRSCDHCVRKNQVFDSYYSKWKYLSTFDVKSDVFALVTRLIICNQLYETTVTSSSSLKTLLRKFRDLQDKPTQQAFVIHIVR